MRAVFDLPLLGAEPAHEEQNAADGQIGEHDRQPDLYVEGVHEREHARLLLLRLLDHNADAELHERLAEVDDSLALRRDRQRGNCHVRHLRAYTVVFSAGLVKTPNFFYKKNFKDFFYRFYRN